MTKKLKFIGLSLAHIIAALLVLRAVKDDPVSYKTVLYFFIASLLFVSAFLSNRLLRYILLGLILLNLGIYSVYNLATVGSFLIFDEPSHFKQTIIVCFFFLFPFLIFLGLYLNYTKLKLQLGRKPCFEDLSNEFDRLCDGSKLAQPNSDINKNASKILEIISQRSKGETNATILLSLASLAGFCCQISIREALAKTRNTSDNIFTVMTCNDGEKYFFGNVLNEALFEGKYSLYNMIAGIVEKNGSNKYPDINEIAEYVTKSIGSEKFGVPRVPDNIKVSEKLPIEHVRELWSEVEVYFKSNYMAPILWSITLAAALQKKVESCKDEINPEIAFKLIMEAAVPMSKIDPKKVGITLYE